MFSLKLYLLIYLLFINYYYNIKFIKLIKKILNIKFLYQIIVSSV